MTIFKRKKIFMYVTLMIIMFVSGMGDLVSEAKALGDNQISFGDETGVDELDDMMDRGDKMGKGVIKFIGKWVAIISFLFFVVSLPTHQSEMRLISLIAFFVSLGVYFGPEIINKILEG